MAGAAAGDIISVSAILAVPGGNTSVNVFQLKNDDVTSYSDTEVLQDVPGYIFDVYSPIVGLYPTATVPQELSVYNITQGAPIGVTAWPLAWVPSGMGDVLPSGVAALVLARTGVSKTMGRKYFGPFTEGVQASSILNSAVLASLADTALAYIAGYSGVNGNWRPGVLDKTGVFRPFLEGVVRNVVAYQRRRRLGRGS